MEPSRPTASAGSSSDVGDRLSPDEAVVLRYDWRKVVALGAGAAAVFIVTIFVVTWAVRDEGPLDWFVLTGLPCILSVPLTISGLLARHSSLAIDVTGLRWVFPGMGSRHSPWSEIYAVYRLLGWPVADMKHPPWGSWLGLQLPLRHQLADRRATEARLRSLRDSRPADQWPKAAREFFSIYCR